MSLQGDLSTLDCAGLFQNLEAAQKSGLLTVQESGGETKLYFHQGKLALITYPDRPDLTEILQASGAVSARELEIAKRRKKGSKRPLGEILVGMKVIDQQRLATIAAARLTGEACELINSGAGAFVFTEGPIPRGVFDPEERGEQTDETQKNDAARPHHIPFMGAASAAPASKLGGDMPEPIVIGRAGAIGSRSIPPPPMLVPPNRVGIAGAIGNE